MDQPHLGHKMPRPGMQRLTWCPSCFNDGSNVTLTSRQLCILTLYSRNQTLPTRHVLENCPAVEQCRRQLGIRAFLDGCLSAGRSRARAYKNYILGLDENNLKVDLKTHLDRGASLQLLTDAWLETWEESDD